MARQRGSLSLPGNFEVGSSASLDARLTAKTLADLNSSNYPFAYKGMLVYVEETDKYYKLTKATVTSANDFVEFSGGGSSTVDTDLDETSANPVQNKAIAVPVNELTASMVGVKSRLDALEDDVDAVSGKFFVAEYNVTTSQELLAYLARTNEPFAPIVVKRGNDYYTSILSAPSGDSAIVMVLGSGGGDFHIFTYTVTEAVWANSGHTLQKKLVSGTDIKTVNGESLLGAGNLNVGVNIEVNKEKWYGTYTDENGVTYQVYIKMIYIPALPSTAGITAYDHGISGIKQILQVYGFTADGFVLNAPRQNAQDNIAIYQMSKSASNKTLSIEVGKDRSSKSAYVVMIYAKNN